MVGRGHHPEAVGSGPTSVWVPDGACFRDRPRIGRVQKCALAQRRSVVLPPNPTTPKDDGRP
jgi:hypothetical protein